jgi:hypothetical protein
VEELRERERLEAHATILQLSIENRNFQDLLLAGDLRFISISFYFISFYFISFYFISFIFYFFCSIFVHLSFYFVLLILIY